MTFESMDDFAPDAIARKVEPLRKLLEARERLSHLLSYMDGKDSAEQLIGKLLGDRNLQEALASHGAKTGDAAG
jgi:type VI secretion system protein ImpB